MSKPGELIAKAKNWWEGRQDKKRIILISAGVLIVLVGVIIGSVFGIRALIKKPAPEEPPEVNLDNVFAEDETSEPASVEEPEGDYSEYFNQNDDMVGWLKIEDTLVDYPVMQTMWDENYYLHLGFDRQYDENGCLIMDTDSVVGIGTADNSYEGGTAPSTNLIIHGHTMKSGKMFGKLSLYENKEYGTEHNIIQFDTKYEHREYELIAVFYSEVFYEDEEVFKFYKFFQADTQAEFDDWYNNIKKMSVYDTGVTAELGDEFITLSCCSYHVEDGRFVVVGKRIK